MTRQEDLIRQGWKKQATCDESRLSEMMELYAQIGMEVRLEPVHPKNEPGCTGCLQIMPERYKTIYTRKKFGKD
jgi:uncharacterized protein (UPF0305 family)